MGQRLEKLEAKLSRNFRLVLLALGGGGLATLSIVAVIAALRPAGFHWVSVVLAPWDHIRGNKSTLEAIQICASVLLTTGGALTAYYIFILQRSAEPALDIAGSVSQVGPTAKGYVINISTKLTNTGKVTVEIAPYLGKAKGGWRADARKAFDDTVTVPASLAIRKVADMEIGAAQDDSASIRFINWWDNTGGTEGWWTPGCATKLKEELEKPNGDKALIDRLSQRRESATTVEVDLVEDYEEGGQPAVKPFSGSDDCSDEAPAAPPPVAAAQPTASDPAPSGPQNRFFMDPGETYEFNHAFVLKPGLYQVKVSFAGPNFKNDYWSRLEVFCVPLPSKHGSAESQPIDAAPAK